MNANLDDLRALVLAEDELLAVCQKVLTVLEHSERELSTLIFSVVDVTVNQRERGIAVQGVLTGFNEETVLFSEQTCRALAEA